MRWDDEEPAKRRREQDHMLRGYLRHELGPFSPYYRQRLAEHGIEPRRVRGLADLTALEPVPGDDFAARSDEFILRPDASGIARHGDRLRVLRLAWARLARRTAEANREIIDPDYKPVAWFAAGGTPATGRSEPVGIGATSTDLDRLATAGSRVLALAGLDRTDVLATVGAHGMSLGAWQLALGARVAGVPAIHLGPEPDAELLGTVGPTALAGPAGALEAALEAVAAAGFELPALHALVVAGENPGVSTRERLASAGARATAGDPPAVVAAWAPPGARALWAECPGGEVFHTFPDLEILEVADGRALAESGAGSLVWSALGWHGTAPFRLDTGVAGEVRDGRCEACGRRGPMMVSPARRLLAGPVRALLAAEAVSEFHIELRRVNGADETLVFLALRRGYRPQETLGALDRSVSATQYVVEARRDVERRVRSGGRILDRR